jgi:hypothetical protein
MCWRPAPATPAYLADGTHRLYVGPPPEDPEGRSQHYHCFCSLVWAAKQQHEMLHKRRDRCLGAKVKVELDHCLGQSPARCDSGNDLAALQSAQTLQAEDVENELRDWEHQWRGHLVQQQRQRDDIAGGLTMWQAKQRTHTRFEAMLNNVYGSHRNYIHFMVHGAYLLDERKLPPPVIPVEATLAPKVHVPADVASSASHAIPLSRPRCKDSGFRANSSYTTFNLLVTIHVNTLHRK